MAQLKRVIPHTKYQHPSEEEKNNAFNDNVKADCKIPTKSGILVQSPGEQKIADFLFDNGIQFDYDTKIELPEDDDVYPDKKVWARPDFRIKQDGTKTNIVIEFWGLYSRDDYDEKTEKKIALYKQEGFNLIEVFTTDIPFLEKHLEKELQKYLGHHL